MGGGDEIGGMDDDVGGHEPGQVEYTYHYIVRPSVSGREKQVEAEIQLVKKGFLRREVVDFRWKGGDLAQQLNADDDLRKMLLREGLSQLSIIEIYADTQNHCTRITLQPQGQQRVGNILTIGRAFPPREAFDIYDRIADHIRRFTAS